MSVEYIKRLAGPYVGDGTGQKTFSFGFLIFEESDVYVAVATSSDSEPSDLQQGTDYTVSMNADQSATPGGTITLTSETGLAKDAVLVIGSAVDYTQTLDLTNYTRFAPERITTELDRIVVMIQQIVELLGRVVQVPPTSSISPSDLFFQLLNAAESAAQSAEDAAASLAACEQIRQLIEQYSWDIPHIVNSLRDVEAYPYDGLFAVAGFGNAGGNGQNISNRYVKAEGSTELRTLGERFADVVNVRDFGAVGDGVTDDTTSFQRALDVGRKVLIPKGKYVISSGLTVSSNTAIEGQGIGVTVISFTSQNQETLFDIANGSENVFISDLSIQGPFYQDSGIYVEDPETYFSYGDSLLANPELGNNTVKYREWSCAIYTRGCYWAQQKDLKEGTNLRSSIEVNKNIHVKRVKAEGFGKIGIWFDNCDNSSAIECIVSRCANMGIFFMGCNGFIAKDNEISHIYPGDLRTPYNRVYGISANRVYGNSNDLAYFGSSDAVLEAYRPSTDGEFSSNRVSYCLGWKGLDTHGGRRISFLNNIVNECHIGIGTDMGGYYPRHGFARVEDILIRGNILTRQTEDLPWEGHLEYNNSELYACVGPGINCGAKRYGYNSNDQEDPEVGGDVQGYNLTIVDNVLHGWGPKGNLGAIHATNYKNAIISNNIIGGSRHCAIHANGLMLNAVISNNIIRDLHVGTGDSIAIMYRKDANSCIPKIIGNTMTQSINANFYYIYGYNAANITGPSIFVDDSNTCSTSYGGTQLNFVRGVSNLDNNSPLILRPIAYGRVLVSDETLTITGFNIKSATRSAAGDYRIRLADDGFDFQKCAVIANSLGYSAADTAIPLSNVGSDDDGTYIRLVFKNPSSITSEDHSFYFVAFGGLNINLEVQ